MNEQIKKMGKQHRGFGAITQMFLLYINYLAFNYLGTWRVLLPVNQVNLLENVSFLPLQPGR